MLLFFCLIFFLNNGFQLATILKRRISTRMIYEIGGFHPVSFIYGRISYGTRVQVICLL
jgi:hypothetical protein